MTIPRFDGPDQPSQVLPVPGPSVRRLHDEGVLILGGARALLMQIAHPAVARGVYEHSAYRADRAGRLLRTLRNTLALAYGDPEEIATAAARINGLHRQVKGPGYDALDPELLAWVLATLIDTSLEMYERFIGPLAEDVQASYYEEARGLGVLLHLTVTAMPPDVRALRTYVRRQCELLEVTPEAREIAAALFEPLPGTGPAMLLMRELTSGLLPPRLREGFGLTWGPLREAQLRTLQALSRRLLPCLPLPLRRTPLVLLPASSREPDRRRT